MISCWCSQDLIERIDRARGGLTRSQFCRDALREKLEQLGYKVEPWMSQAPDRTGKGGPKKGRLKIVTDDTAGLGQGVKIARSKK